MQIPQPESDGTRRLLRAAGVLVVVTFLVWGAWMTVALLLGVIGWVGSAIGGALLSAMRIMTSIHGTVAAIAAGAGTVLAVLLALDVPVDRLWNRFGRSRTAGENT